MAFSEEEKLNMLKSIGGRLKTFREKYSPEVLAFTRELGLDNGNWGKAEKGERGVSIESLLVISTNKGVNLHWLLTGEGEMFMTQKGATDSGLQDKLRELEANLGVLRVFVEDGLAALKPWKPGQLSAAWGKAKRKYAESLTGKADRPPDEYN